MEITKLRHKKTGFWGFVVAVASFSIMFLFENNLVTTNPDAILNEILIRDLTRYIIVILSVFCYIINVLNCYEPVRSWVIIGSTAPLMLWWALWYGFYVFLTLIGAQTVENHINLLGLFFLLYLQLLHIHPIMKK